MSCASSGRTFFPLLSLRRRGEGSSAAEPIVELIVLGKCDDFLAPTLHHCSLSPYSSSSLFPTSWRWLLGWRRGWRLFLLSNRVRNCTLGRWWIMICRMWKVGTILDTQILQMMMPSFPFLYRPKIHEKVALGKKEMDTHWSLVWGDFRPLHSPKSFGLMLPIGGIIIISHVSPSSLKRILFGGDEGREKAERVCAQITGEFRIS